MRTELKRELGLLDATMINLGTIIASAIFLVPSFIAQQLHASSLVILAWLVGGVVSLLGALTVAELGAAFPRRVDCSSICAKRTGRCGDSCTAGPTRW